MIDEQDKQGQEPETPVVKEENSESPSAAARRNKRALILFSVCSALFLLCFFFLSTGMDKADLESLIPAKEDLTSPQSIIITLGIFLLCHLHLQPRIKNDVHCFILSCLAALPASYVALILLNGLSYGMIVFFSS